MPREAVDVLCPRCLLLRAMKPSAPESSEPALLTAAEREFGDYELMEEIARGGMGVVYKARQRGLDRVVALKLLLLGPLADDDYVRRFRFEAVAAGCLRHPHIVQIYEVGLHEGQPFIAMEFVEGQNLARIAGGNPLATHRAATYLKAIAEAIHAAHESGILHRDLKPSNVMVDFLDQPRVTDFGLARRLESETDLTLSGQMLGTPNYLPPEQAAFNRGGIRRTSDVYGLGAIFYHLLTGRPPHSGQSVAETLHQALHGEPVRPRLLNPAASVDAETICLKCLEKEPSKRYATARELAEDLGRLLDGAPIHARPVSPVERAWRWCKRKPALATALGISLMLGAIIAIGSPIVAYRLNRARAEALASGAEARKAAQSLAMKAEELMRSIYGADMLLAQQALAENNLGRARDLLSKHAQSPDKPVPTISGGLPQDFRGWEWRYLYGVTRGEHVFKWRPDGSRIDFIAWDGQGERLAVACMSGLVAVLDANHGGVIATNQVDSLVHALAICPTEGILALADSAGKVVLGPLDSPGIGSTLPSSNHIGALAFSPDGRWLFTGGAGHLEAWPVGNLTCPAHQLRDPRIKAARLGISPDSGTVLVSGSDGSIALWHPGRGDWRVQEHAHRLIDGPGLPAIPAVAFSSDGSIAYSAGLDQEIALWDATTLSPLRRFRADHSGWLGSFAVLHRRNRFVTSGPDQLIRLWNGTDGRELRALRGHGDEAWHLAVSPDETTIASGSKDGEVLLWHPDRNPGERSAQALPADTIYVALSENARFCVTFHDGGSRYRIWNTARLEETSGGTLSGSNPRCGAVSNDGTRLLTMTSPGQLRVWDAGVETPVAVLEVLQPPPTDRRWQSHNIGREVSFSHGESQFAAACGNTLVIWDANSFRELARWMDVPGTIYSIGFSHDNSVVAAGAWDGELTAWSLGDRRKRFSLPPDRRNWPVLGIDFTPDNTRMVTASGAARLQLRTADGVADPTPLPRATMSYWSVAVSPDGERLMGGTGEGVIRVVDIRTGVEMAVLKGHQRPVRAVGFLPDGNTLVSASTDSLRLWHANPVSTHPSADAPATRRPQTDAPRPRSR